MPSPVPDNPHDAALWLLCNLQGIAPSPLDAEILEGRLPPEHDFGAVVEALTQLEGGLFQASIEQSRVVRFSPERAAVYDSLASMLSAQKGNLTGIPQKFFLRDLRYSYDGNRELAPPCVQAYLDVVFLCSALKALSDYSSSGGRRLNFVVRPDAKFRISIDYTVKDLHALEGISAFVRDFIHSEFHEQEKRDIARDGLAELVRGRSELALPELIQGFGVYVRNARASYALLLAKFSSASVQKEIDKQNLEDALRLNKTFSEIQNQLLALPAALLVAGAAIESGAAFKNVSIMVGISIFAVLMWMLVRNQKNSVKAIGTELAVRRRILDAQPDAIADHYKDAFSDLHQRTESQLKALNVVLWLVSVVFSLVLFAVLDSLLAGELSAQLAAALRVLLFVLTSYFETF